MQPSLEIRWFRKGTVPADLAASVEKWPFKPDLDDRDDIYLLDLESTNGIKLRSGKNIEVKRFVSDHGVRELRSSTIGRLERWGKWSFELSPQPKTQPDLSLPGSWAT